MRIIGNCLFFLCAAISLDSGILYAQMQANFTTQVNSLCDGMDCSWEGPSILINEMMISPSANQYGSVDGSLVGSANGPQRGEWIELYNPNICEPIDISCYYLASYVSAEGRDEAYLLPPNTIVPPGGFCVLRGAYSEAVNPNLLVQNGGNTIEIVLGMEITQEGMCVESGMARFWFPNAGGWFGFYDRDGVPQDAVSWGNFSGTGNKINCIPSRPNCNNNISQLGSYNDFPSNRKQYVYTGSGIFSSGVPDSWGQSLLRIPDGGDWVLEQGSGANNYSIGSCNATCAEVGSSTCNGVATINVTGGSGDYSYSWNDSEAQMTQTATGLCSGVYEVTVTDNQTNEQQVFTVEIENLELDISSEGFDLKCNNKGEIEVTAHNGEGPYQYSIDNGGNFQSNALFNNLDEGDYDIMVIDSHGCEGKEEQELLYFEIPELSLDPTIISCKDTCDAQIFSTVTKGEAPFTYEWMQNNSVIGTNVDIEDLCAGTYSLTVTDSLNCKVTEETEILNPDILTYTITGTDLTCGNIDGIIEIGNLANNEDYHFYYSFNHLPKGNATYTSDGAGKIIFTDLEDGIYGNFVLIGPDGCPLENSSPNEIVLTAPERPVIIAPNDTTVCLHDEITFEVIFLPNQNTTITWDNGIENGVPFTMDELGSFTYTVTGVLANCTATDEITIEVIDIPYPNFVGDTLFGCSPFTVNFSKTAPIDDSDIVNCVWNFGDGTQGTGCNTINHTYQHSGEFSVTLTLEDERGCFGSITKDEYVKVIPVPVANFQINPARTDLLNTNIELINDSKFGEYFEWDFGDNSPISHDTSSVIEHLYPNDEAKNYTITLIAVNELGCSDTVREVLIIDEPVIFYAPNTFTPDDDNFNEVFLPIITSGIDIYSYHMSIYNRWGEILFESSDIYTGWDGTYGGKIVKEGTYVWKIEFKEKKSDEHRVIVGHINLLK